MTRLGALKIVEQKIEKKEENKPASPPLSDSAGQKLAQAAYTVRKTLGGGLGKDIYRQCLAEELRRAGLSVVEDISFPVKYGNMNIAGAFTADIVIGGTSLVVIHAEHASDADYLRDQAATFLKISGLSNVYIMNFAAKDMRQAVIKASARSAKIIINPDKGSVN
ncbi:MAG: GxxExxY protein [Proteobacteria bacterium]|nr:GxxExxY protein [Pseudomonadota bacterium]